MAKIAEIKPIPVKHGQKITEPGVYAMPMGWYHSDCCDGPSISSTGLRKIQLYSPAHYWVTSPLNPFRLEDPDDAEKKHFRMGRAAHTLLLEPQLFKAEYVTRPGIFDSWRTNDSKKWRAEQILAGKTVLTDEEYRDVVGIAAALRNHGVHEDGLLDGLLEVSIIWKDPLTGVWLKVRPDAVPKSSNMLVDPKMCADGRPRAIHRATFEYGYDMQQALIGVGIQKVMARTIEDYVLVFIESSAPYAIRIAPLDRPVIHWGRIKCRAALNRFATCWRETQAIVQAAGGDLTPELKERLDICWPSYDRLDGEHIMMSQDEERRLKDAQKAKELPKSFEPTEEDSE